jgi:hypothetical protein
MRRCKGCTNGNWAVGRFGAPSLNAEDRNATSGVAAEMIITIAEEVVRTNRTGDTMIDGIEMITEEESTETTIEETTIEETTLIEIETETTIEGTPVTMIVEGTTLDTAIVGSTGDTMTGGMIIEETTIEETITAEMDTAEMDTEIVDTSTVDTTIDAATTEIVPVLTSAIPARHLLEISQR